MLNSALQFHLTIQTDPTIRRAEENTGDWALLLNLTYPFLQPPIHKDRKASWFQTKGTDKIG